MRLGWMVMLVSTYLLTSCNTKSGDKIDLIIYGGDIVTMNDDMRSTEAVAIVDGMIHAVGTYEEMAELANEETVLKDLSGKTLLPGFIDAHSHITLAMKTFRWADLSSPPVSDVTSVTSLIAKLKKHQESRDIEEGDWIMGWGYDPDQLEEKRHPTSAQLTEAFPKNPVFLLHVSGHMAAVNEAALTKAQINIETADPAGGTIIRDPLSKRATGLVQEKAVYMFLPLFPLPSQSEMVEVFGEVQDHYAKNGITTAQDGLTDYPSFQFLKGIADQGLLKLDVEALGSFMAADKFYEDDLFGSDNNGLRLTGMKIVSDGSPQGKTAFFRDPYLTIVPGCSHECRGMPTIEQPKLKELMAKNYSLDIQTYVHSNGDGAIQMLLDTHKEVVDSLGIDKDGQRTVVIHSQFVGNDQLKRYKEYGFIPSFFSNHAFFWGDVHVDNLGIERASFLSPLKSATDMGIIATNHTDYTITPIDQLFLTWTAVNRETRSGTILGPDERVSAWDALKTVTINGAYQHRVEDKKGSIEIGKMADFVILDNNPLTVEPKAIKDIKVLETIKEGKTIYSQ